jgi:ribose transport system ATP-binding protein
MHALKRELPLEPAFEVRDVSRNYLGVEALKNVSLSGFPGEVLAICGANGAGKSTLARLLAGQERSNSGSIRVRDFEGEIVTPADAEDAGILLMHQDPLVIDTFTVAENVRLKELSQAHHVKPWQLVSRKNGGSTRRALDAVGLSNVSLDQAAGTLSLGLRQILALSRTQMNPHKILLMDETTASTTEEYFKDVLALVNKEKSEGVCVVFVSHRMQEVFSMSDRIAVLRNGELVGIRRTSETDHDEIMAMMIGEMVERLEAKHETRVFDAKPAMRVRNLSSGSARDITFDVRVGEILGIYGLVGSGRSSIARSIAGHQHRISGEVIINDRVVNPKTPRQALRSGIAYVSEDRRREGFIPDFTNQHNITLSTPGKFSLFGIIRIAKERDHVRKLINRYTIKGSSNTFTRNLSGGNQQKVCLAKWLEAKPAVIILDEPTKGVDVGARMNIYGIIRQLAQEERAVVVVSSEAEEILSLCNRILIIRDGQLVREMSPERNSVDDVIRAALGGKAK